MADDFDRFIPEARGFLARLKDNNTRDWFKAHQSEFDANVRAPALLVLDVLVPRLSAITGEAVTTKLFRPHRDVRFSKDKTPYHIHCHMLWHAPAGSPVSYYLGISPDYVRIGAGVMGFSKTALDSWRRVAGSPDAGGLAQELSALQSEGHDLSEPELKRVPAPFDKDHSHGDLLRRKSLTVWADADPGLSDLPGLLEARFARFSTLCALLAPIV